MSKISFIGKSEQRLREVYGSLFATVPYQKPLVNLGKVLLNA